MTFTRDWILIFAVVPIAWAIFEWRRTQRHLALVLKALSFAAVIVALAEPHVSTTETRVALAVLVDTSAAVSSSDLERASQLAASIENNKGRHWVRVIPFARSTRTLDATEAKNIRLTAGEPGRATDLEAAVREAVASLPAGMLPRVALISDGMENKGSIARAAWQAQQLGIPIDTFAMKGRVKPALRLESVSLPSIAFTGEQFPIDLTVSAPAAESAEIEMAAEGRPLGRTNVALNAGENPVRLHAALNTPGALDLSIAIRSNGGEVRYDQAGLLKRPKGLYRYAPARGAHRRAVRYRSRQRFHPRRSRALPAHHFQQLGPGGHRAFPQGRAGKIREAGRRIARHRRRAQRLRRGQKGGGRAGPRSARQARSAALSRRHGRRHHHR